MSKINGNKLGEQIQQNMPPFSVQEPEREYWKNNRKVLISCSDESKDIATLVTQPLIYRRAVGYNAQLLEKYLPNETFYLPIMLRDHLYNLGKTPDIVSLA